MHKSKTNTRPLMADRLGSSSSLSPTVISRKPNQIKWKLRPNGWPVLEDQAFLMDLCGTPWRVKLAEALEAAYRALPSLCMCQMPNVTRRKMSRVSYNRISQVLVGVWKHTSMHQKSASELMYLAVFYLWKSIPLQTNIWRFLIQLENSP